MTYHSPTKPGTATSRAPPGRGSLIALSTTHAAPQLLAVDSIVPDLTFIRFQRDAAPAGPLRSGRERGVGRVQQA
ncbi:hypothetical protein [Streptomyces sp. NPDC001787]|uniref:hypothetical protein n=1 Tax=Streptomyces sp. NPDC001787 TaxID=3154523 RepID=UPI00331E9097